LTVFGGPIPSQFIFGDNCSLKYLIVRIKSLLVAILSEHLFFINIVNLGPRNSVIKIYSINAILLNNFYRLVNEQIPSIQFTIV
jgi:hypothetical protein